MKVSIATKILIATIIPTIGFGVLSYLMFGAEMTTVNIFILTIVCLLYCLSFLAMSMTIYDMVQTKHTLKQVFPLVARLRWVFESERPKIQQYFIEHDLNGTPYSREKRSDIYQKAKGDKNTTPFVTQLNVYQKGYEFLKHSLYPKATSSVADLKFQVGSKFCTKPYTSSVFGISAMSYGSLSKTAIEALNGGAMLGNFHHNTGEGGISDFHLKRGGDLVFQIGTGYFGCGKTVDGKREFDADMFIKNASNESVKMIEIKLSQGAKPGHGGVLPAVSNTEEIARIRGIEESGVTIKSPSYHTVFDDANSMLDFIMNLRVLANGKPIGVKMCVGNRYELEELIKMMSDTDRYPDFITIDGSEGGTGAAPIVYANKMGTPLTEGLLLTNRLLFKHGLRKEIKIYASGKASDSFDIVRLLSLGADGVNAARAFMMSLGCIQARDCGNCPVGIATQKSSSYKKLNPDDKSVRVFNYHNGVLHEVKEVIASMGLDSHTKLAPYHINIRGEKGTIETYEDIAKRFQ